MLRHPKQDETHSGIFLRYKNIRRCFGVCQNDVASLAGASVAFVWSTEKEVVAKPKGSRFLSGSKPSRVEKVAFRMVNDIAKVARGTL